MNTDKPVSTFLKDNMEDIAQTVIENTFSKSIYTPLIDGNRETLNGIVLYHLLRLNDNDRILLMEHFCSHPSKEKIPDECFQLAMCKALSHLQKNALPGLLSAMSDIASEATNAE